MSLVAIAIISKFDVVGILKLCGNQATVSMMRSALVDGMYVVKHL